MSNTSSPLRDPKMQQRTVLAVMGLLGATLILLLFAIIISSVASACSLPTQNDVSWVDMSVDAEDVKGGPLVLINSTHKYLFPADAEATLTNIYAYQSSFKNKFSYSGSNLKLDAAAMEHSQKMLDALVEETNLQSDFLFINASAAYRSAKDQENLNSDTAAGDSDHHSGMLLALGIYDNGLMSIYDEGYNGYGNWLLNNSYKYGFVQRYPEGKSTVTGVQNYAEAYRYVGIPHAKHMHDNNMVLEEYVDFLKNSTSFKKPLIIKADNGVRYLVYHAAVSEATSIKVPALNDAGEPTYKYTVSGTNDGGVVVTVELG